MCKVTICVSAYNVSDYLRDCLHCILSQSFVEYELLCIDDSSTDCTWEILQKFASNDSRIRLIRQRQNLGLSVSRNLAIQEARGEYLLMLDGDDLFAPDMLEKAYSKAIETKADMVMWDYVVFKNEEEISHKIKLPSSLTDISPANKIALLRRPAFIWTRLIKTRVMRDLSVHFPEGLTKQDIPVHWQLVTSLDRIALLPERLSFYRQQPNSTSNDKGEKVFSLAHVMDIVKQGLLASDRYDEYKDEFLRSRLSLLYGMYDAVLPELKQEALILIKERLREDEMNYLSNSKNELPAKTKYFYGKLRGNKWSSIKYISFISLRSLYRKIKNLA